MRRKESGRNHEEKREWKKSWGEKRVEDIMRRKESGRNHEEKREWKKSWGEKRGHRAKYEKNLSVIIMTEMKKLIPVL